MFYGFLTVLMAIAVLAAMRLTPVRKLLARRRATGSEGDAKDARASLAMDEAGGDENSVMLSVQEAVAPDVREAVAEEVGDDEPNEEELAEERDVSVTTALEADHDAFAFVAADEADEETEDQAEEHFNIETLFDAEVPATARDDADEQNVSAATGNGPINLFSGGTRVDRDTSPPVIEDYDPAEDQLVVVFDSAITPEPDITIDPVSGSADVFVLLNGQPVMLVRDAANLAPDDIELIETDLSEEDSDGASGPFEDDRLETATAA